MDGCQEPPAPHHFSGRHFSSLVWLQQMWVAANQALVRVRDVESDFSSAATSAI